MKQPNQSPSHGSTHIWPCRLIVVAALFVALAGVRTPMTSSITGSGQAIVQLLLAS